MCNGAMVGWALAFPLCSDVAHFLFRPSREEKGRSSSQPPRFSLIMAEPEHGMDIRSVPSTVSTIVPLEDKTITDSDNNVFSNHDSVSSPFVIRPPTGLPQAVTNEASAKCCCQRKAKWSMSCVAVSSGILLIIFGTILLMFTSR